MIRHCVVLRWNPSASEEGRANALRALRSLPDQIDEIAGFTVGGDLGFGEGNHDLAIVADFRSPEDYLTYAGHPDHLAVLRDHVKPVLESRAAVQFEVT